MPQEYTLTVAALCYAIADYTVATLSKLRFTVTIAIKRFLSNVDSWCHVVGWTRSTGLGGSGGWSARWDGFALAQLCGAQSQSAASSATLDSSRMR